MSGSEKAQPQGGGGTGQGAPGSGRWRPLAELELLISGAVIFTRFRYVFYRHPETGVRGLRAYLSTAALPAGRNVLVLLGAAAKRELDKAEDAAERRWLERLGTVYLPFWK